MKYYFPDLLLYMNLPTYIVHHPLLPINLLSDTYILDVTYLPTMADFVLNNQQTSSLKCLQYLTARSHEIDADRADKVARQFFLAKINHEVIITPFYFPCLYELQK